MRPQRRLYLILACAVICITCGNPDVQNRGLVVSLDGEVQQPYSTSYSSSLSGICYSAEFTAPNVDGIVYELNILFDSELMSHVAPNTELFIDNVARWDISMGALRNEDVTHSPGELQSPEILSAWVTLWCYCDAFGDSEQRVTGTLLIESVSAHEIRGVIDLMATGKIPNVSDIDDEIYALHGEIVVDLDGA